MYRTFFTIFAASILFLACKSEDKQNQVIEFINLMHKDPHTLSNYQQVKVKHVSLFLEVDFGNKELRGHVLLKIDNLQRTDRLKLDTKDLSIESVTVDSVSINNYSMETADSILGTALIIPIEDSTEIVEIQYRTSPKAAALQWLSPQQTDGGIDPFLFTQSQAILCRSWIPIQDTPAVRFTYDASVKVPAGMLALMSAANPQQSDSSGIYQFKMEQPIPSYLMALAVGDMEFEPLTDRIGVYAESSMLSKASNEFADLPKMMAAAANLFGPYSWSRYDVLVMPSSFPFGGMENPRLTFATPTIIAGDRSLTSLIAHELAHSWSGNLVTNESWEELWLNEGFTVYFEYRIMEELYGKEYAEMLMDQSYTEMNEAIEQYAGLGKSKDTKLKLDLLGRDPDVGMSAIAYDKGFFFIRELELLAGRDKFDQFLKEYFQDFAFKSINTDQFVVYLQQNFPAQNRGELNSLIDNWIFSAGLPKDFVWKKSDRLRAVEKEVSRWKESRRFDSSTVANWSAHEWVYALENLPDSISREDLNSLDESYNFSKTQNAEVKFVWLKLCVENEYRASYSELERFLVETGRRKFLVPLYEKLLQKDKQLAKQIYSRARENYHFVSYHSIDQIFNEQ